MNFTLTGEIPWVGVAEKSTMTSGPGSGPCDTTKSTALPALTEVPATGFWLMTSPTAAVVWYAPVTAPTMRSAPVSAASAADWVRPTTSGAITSCGGSEPLETTMLTLPPLLTIVPAVGLWLMTLPVATVSWKRSVTVPIWRFAFVMALCAAA